MIPELWVQDEITKPADGPVVLANESSDPSGPGDPRSRSNVVHNLAGKGRFDAGDGDHSSELDEPWRCNNVPGCVESPISGTAPSRGHLQHVEILTGNRHDGSGHSLSLPKPDVDAPQQKLNDDANRISYGTAASPAVHETAIPETFSRE